MKFCPQCKQNKENKFFYLLRRRGRIERQSYCIVCSAKRRAKYHIKNKKREEKVKNKRIEKLHAWYIEYKKTLTCSHCGEDRWYLLDFHHHNGDKEFNVGSVIGKCSLQKVINEIKKCIVLCTNCHRELHFLENNSGSIV